jgi:hypothetical protein
MRKTTIATMPKGNMKYCGTLAGMDFIGEYEKDPRNKSILVSITMEFPKLNTAEDVYTIVSHELKEEDYGSYDEVVYEAENIITTSFKDIGVKGVWK